MRHCSGSSTFATSFDVSVSFLRRTMAKRKRSRRISDEERRLLDAQYEETTRLLEERIAYHRAKIAKERARRERPLWRRLLPG